MPELLVRIAAALAVSWLALVVVLLLLRPAGVDLAEARRFVPDVVRLVRALTKDPQLGRGVHLRLVLLLAYLAMPFDPVPDFVPVLGYADDVIVIALVLRSVVRHAGGGALERHWQGTPQGLAVLHRLAGLSPA